MILSWLLKTALGRIAGGVLVAIILGGVFYANSQIKGCIRDKDTIKQYQRADEVRQEDKKTDDQIEKEQKRIDRDPGFDFDAELERLRQHSKADN